MNNSQQSNSFVCTVRDGMLFDYSGNQVGVTLEQYNAVLKERNTALEAAKKFEDKLYEAGILQRPKTQEEITAELQATVQSLADAVGKLTDKINSM